MPKLPIPSGWNKRVQSAILQAISLSRHCFVTIVARMANIGAQQGFLLRREFERFAGGGLYGGLQLAVALDQSIDGPLESSLLECEP